MRIPKEAVILDAKGATGVGSTVDCTDYRFAVVSLATDGGGDADLTVQFQGAITGDVAIVAGSSDPGSTVVSAPLFGSAQSVTNMWDYIEVIDLEDGTAYDGDTGIVVSGDDYRLFQVNTDGLKYFNAEVSARSEGEVTIKAIFFSN